MMDKHQSTSKFLSLVLRHKPETIGLQLDQSGWASVEELITKMQAQGTALSVELLTEIVETNDKKRFIFSDDRTRIRANQGHSIDIDLGLAEVKPPQYLFHGTATRNLDSIREKGLMKGERHQVHLTEDKITAEKVGARYGKSIVLIVQAGTMYQDQFRFYRSENGVWLTEFVPPQYLE